MFFWAVDEIPSLPPLPPYRHLQIRTGIRLDMTSNLHAHDRYRGG